MNTELRDTLLKVAQKVTSGRFIATVVVVFVYAFLACKGILKEDRVIEITLIVLYAYFNKKNSENISSTTTSTTTPR